MPELISYPLYSLFGVEDAYIDKQMYDEYLKSFPTILCMPYGDAVPCNAVTNYTGWNADLLTLISQCLLRIRSSEELRDLSDDMGIRYADVAFNVRYKHAFDPAKTHDMLREQYRLFLTSSFYMLKNMFVSLEIPYFEDVLPYKVLIVDTDSEAITFRKLSFDEFKTAYGHMFGSCP